jgi:tetratricopeptide (TPR) repeat protein
MAPEQARGEVDQLDERCDVFGLGGILCVLLTGRPPHRGTRHEEVKSRAAQGELGDALARLSTSGADEELIVLARRCLAAEKAERPRHAGEVVQALGTYLAGVQERLRASERQRAAAEARAQEAGARAQAERRARRLLLGLAAVVLVLVLAGGGAAWFLEQQRAADLAHQLQTDRDTAGILEQARSRLDEGWQAHDLAKLKEAQAAGERAVDVARSGSASPAVQQQAAALRAQVEERLGRAVKTRALLLALLDVSPLHQTKPFGGEGTGKMTALAQPSVDEQYAAAFRHWGLDVDRAPEAEVVARLREQPQVVVQEIIAGLHGWLLERLAQKRPAAEWRRLLRVVEQLDRSAWHRELRSLLIGPRSRRAESAGGLFAAAPPWLGLWELGPGRDWRRLQELRGRVDLATEPVLTVALLAQASEALGDAAGAEEVLRLALAPRPDEVVLLDVLGRLLERQGRRRLPEAIGCYRAVRARRPDLGIALGRALAVASQGREAEAVLNHLARTQPTNPKVFFQIGFTLAAQKKYAAAVTAYRSAVALNDQYPGTHNNLGAALHEQGKLDEAEAVYRKAIALKPDLALAHNNLGNVLRDHGRLDEAEVSYRKAIALKPDSALACSNLAAALADRDKLDEAAALCHKAIALNPGFGLAYSNLGNILRQQGKLDEAEPACRKAIALEPELAAAHVNLGTVLHDRGKSAEAEAAQRRAIALQPGLALAHTNLGTDLHDQGRLAEAEAAHRRAVALRPDLAVAHTNLGNVLHDQGKLAEAEAAHRQAIALEPRLAGAYSNLARTLHARGKAAEALANCRKAVELKPDSATAQCNLGNALQEEGELAEAEAVYRKAIQLKPDFATVHSNLGDVLRKQRKLNAAAASYHRALALRPDLALAHSGLGTVLHQQGKLAEAVAEQLRAVALQPDLAPAHRGLGAALGAQGKLPEAAASLRKAVQLDPGYAEAYTDLAVVLSMQNNFDEAVAVCLKAIDLRPKSADYRIILGLALMQQGRPNEALSALNQGSALLPADEPRQAQLRRWIEGCERQAKLDERLPAVLKGIDKASSAVEQLEFARLCALRKLYAASARFYEAAFAAEAKGAAAVPSSVRIQAACAAALAGCGQGKDAPDLDAGERARRRQQALDWLRLDLKWWRQALDSAGGQARAAIAQRLRRWEANSDLAGVRDRTALDRLPEAERRQWLEFWADVEALQRRALAPK